MPQLQHAPKASRTPEKAQEKALEKAEKLQFKILSPLFYGFLNKPNQKITAKKGNEAIEIRIVKNRLVITWSKGQEKEIYITYKIIALIEKNKSNKPNKTLSVIDLIKRLQSFPSLKTKSKQLIAAADAKQAKEQTGFTRKARARKILTPAEYKKFIILKKKGVKRNAKENNSVLKLTSKVMNTPITATERLLERRLNTASLMTSIGVLGSISNYLAAMSKSSTSSHFVAAMKSIANPSYDLMKKFLENKNKKPTSAQKIKLDKLMKEIDKLTKSKKNTEYIQALTYNFKILAGLNKKLTSAQKVEFDKLMKEIDKLYTN